MGCIGSERQSLTQEDVDEEVDDKSNTASLTVGSGTCDLWVVMTSVLECDAPRAVGNGQVIGVWASAETIGGRSWSAELAATMQLFRLT